MFRKDDARYGDGSLRAPETSPIVREHIVCTDNDCEFEHYYSYRRPKGRSNSRKTALTHVRNNPGHTVQVKRIETLKSNG